MQRAPSKAAEWLTGILTPPACREYVLGDLHERYTGPVQYFADALSTVPLVILSRIRRTTDPALLLMEAFAIYISFLAGPWYFQQGQFLYEEDGLLRLAIPAAIALLALVLRDAYRSGPIATRITPVQDALWCMGAAFLFQAGLSVWHPEIGLPRWIMVSGASMSLALVSALRLLFPPCTWSHK